MTVLSGLEAALADRVPDRYDQLVRAERVGQFITTGAVGVAVELVVLAALVELVNAHELVGEIVGKEAAVIVMFALNEHWTYADSGRPGLTALARRLLRSNLARAVGNGVALAVFVILLWLKLWYIASALVGIAVGFVFNYLLETLYTWESHRTAG